MSLQAKNEQKAFLKEVNIKALSDSSFKERLIANPVEAIQELYPGFNPGETKIVVQDQTAPETVYINISRTMVELIAGSSEELELTEEELEMVAGGILGLERITLFGSCFNRGCTSSASK